MPLPGSAPTTIPVVTTWAPADRAAAKNKTPAAIRTAWRRSERFIGESGCFCLFVFPSKMDVSSHPSGPVRLGDLALPGHETPQRSIPLENRRNVDGDPVGRSILAIVHHRLRARLPGVNGLMHALRRSVIGQFA